MRDDHLFFLAATYGLALLIFLVEALLTLRRHRRALQAPLEDA